MEEKRYLKYKNGRKQEIVSEDGKYFVCKNARYKKWNPEITVVTEQKEGKNNADH